MNVYFKPAYILALILCCQPSFTEVVTSRVPIHQNIHNLETQKIVDQLLLLIQKRLVVMHEVARTKWNQNLPIEDKVREQQILMDLAKQANKFNVDEKWVVKFFQAQIDAAKEIQKNDFAFWKQQALQKFEKVLSLKDELRFYIDQINQEMMVLLSQMYGKDQSGKFILDHPISNRDTDYIENEIWLLAISPLIAL